MAKKIYLLCPSIQDGGLEKTLSIYANFLEKIINDWLLKKTRSEAEAIFNKNGVPAGPVNSAKDIFSSEQVKARKSIIEIDDPEVGNHKFARGPVVLSDCPEVETSPAPSLGQHTNEILSNLLEYSEERIKGLLDSKIIGVPKER